jgi:hypothetical protein
VAISVELQKVQAKLQTSVGLMISSIHQPLCESAGTMNSKLKTRRLPLVWVALC